ncbi:MAG: type II toxin-antitoxin system RelE/ParE family toxin [Cyanobacteria bacterium J06633_8]
MSEQQFIQVEITSTFNKNIRKLAKKYRNIRSDIQPVIEQLEQGELPGDKISGTNYTIFKLRVSNSEIQKGKSSGYRIIYYLKTSTGVVLLTIYTKSKKADITASEISDIITEYEQRRVEDVED